MKIDWNSKYTTIAVYTILTVLAIMLLYVAIVNFDDVTGFFDTLNDVLAPVYIGLAIAYLANPIMKMCETRIFRFKITNKSRFHLKRALSITLSFIIILIILTILLLLILPQVYVSISDLSSKMSGYIKDTVKWLDSFLPNSIFGDAEITLSNFVNSIGSWLYDYLESSSIGEELNDIQKQLSLIADNLDTLLTSSFAILKDYVPVVMGAFTGFAGGVLDSVLGIFFAIYILSSKEKLIAQAKKVLRAFTGEKQYNGVLELANFTNKTFGGYLVGKIVDSLIVGVLVFIGCIVFGIPYAILVSVLIAVTNVIPIIGPFLGAIPGVLIIFIVDPAKVLWFIIINLVIQQIDGNIIVPILLGESTGLSSLWVLFSITVMGGMWGLFGMFISVPIFAIIYTLIKLLVEKKLASRALPTETDNYYSDVEIRAFPDHDDNQHSFAARIKKISNSITPAPLGGMIKKIKAKAKKKKPDPDNSDK